MSADAGPGARSLAEVEASETELRAALREAVAHMESHGLPGLNRSNIEMFKRWEILAAGGAQ